MTQSNPREEALRLMDKRKLLEAEMNLLSSRLNAPNMPGIAGNLMDKEVSTIFQNGSCEPLFWSWQSFRIFITALCLCFALAGGSISASLKPVVVQLLIEAC